MSILKGPISLNKVAELVKAATLSGLGPNRYNEPNANIAYWRPEDVIKSGTWYPSHSRTIFARDKLIERGLLSMLAEKSEEFACAVNGFYGKRLEVKTRIFNLTMMDGLINGQTFHPTKEYLIHHVYGSTNFDNYLDKRVAEAQVNIDKMLKLASIPGLEDLL